MTTYLYAGIESYPQTPPSPEEEAQWIRLVADIVQAHAGRVIKHTTGGMAIAFPADNKRAIQCALELMLRTQQHPWPKSGEIRPRIALHTGEDLRLTLNHLDAYHGQKEDFFGKAINRVAYLMNQAWGGQILVTEQTLSTQVLPVGATLRFQGAIEVKEHGVTLNVYQVDHPALRYHHFPPLKGSQETHLPHFDTPFLGREHELASLLSLLSRPEERLITIVGPGGIGKTRLAVQAAIEYRPTYRGHIVFVPLEHCRQSEALLPVMLDALALHPHARLDPTEQLLTFLRNRRVLLVLDNAEQVQGIQDLVGAMLQETSHTTLLVTSRRRLGLRFETIFPLKGFHPNDQDAAVQLFIQSARLVQPTFAPTPDDEALIREIVQQLDGIPLNIRLVAASVAQRSCREILQRLRQGGLPAAKAPGLPNRHRSLETSFRYSWNLLSEEERRLLQRLSVLEGGFDIEAAAAVAQATPLHLRHLLQKSLLKRDEHGRFALPDLFRHWLLETEALTTPERQDAYQQARHFYTQRLQHILPQLRSAEQAAAVQRLAHDLPNLLRLWEDGARELQHSSQPAGIMRVMAQALFEFYRLRPNPAYAEQLFAAIPASLAMRENTLNQEEQYLFTLCLLRQSYFLLLQGKKERAWPLARLGAEHARRGRFLAEAAFAAYLMSELAEADYRLDAAVRYAQQAIELGKRLELIPLTADALATLGAIHLRQKEIAQAESALLEALHLYHQLGDPNGLGRVYNNLSIAALEYHNPVAALEYLQQSLELRRQTGNDWSIARILNNMAHIYQQQGDLDTAERLLDESLEISRRIGDRRMTGLVLLNRAFLKSFYRNDLLSAKVDYLESIQQFSDLSPHNAFAAYTDLAIALCMHGDEEQRAEAHRHLLTASRLAIEANTPPHEGLALHLLFGWAIYHGKHGNYQQAADIAACLKQQPRFLKDLQTDPGVRAYFEQLEALLDSHLPPSAREASFSQPKPPSAFYQQLQQLVRRHTA